MPQLIDIRSFINQTLLPQRCLPCGDAATGAPICPACRAELPWLNTPSCATCGIPTPTGNVCGTCLQHPPAFDATHAILDYRFPVDAMLRRYKYSGFLAVAELMGTLLAERLQHAQKPDLLIPMPLHPLRLKERGFNQAIEIARVLCRHLQVPLELQACSRTRPTTPQAGLSLRERHKNLRGVFACHQNLSGKHVALLDDVMTTGASLDALARAVKDAGAMRVECWVVARTPMGHS